MSLSKQLMLDLLAYADGELDGDAKRRIESILAKDEEAREIVAAASVLGEGVRFAEDARVLPHAADTIVDGVMARVANEEIGFLDETNEPKVVRLKRAAPVAAVSFALAMAAGWFLFFRGPAVTPEGNKTAGLATTAVTASASAHEERDVAAGPEGAELESADSPVSVFFVSTTGDDLNKKAVSSVVVWLGDSLGGQGSDDPGNAGGTP